MLTKLLRNTSSLIKAMNSHFRLRSTGERVEIVHVMNDDDQVLCLVENEKSIRMVVREQELELEVLHIGATVALCAGLAFSGAIFGWTIHP